MGDFLPAKPQLVFYANSSLEIGIGHIMRSVALAQAAAADFEVLFTYLTCLPQLITRIKSLGFETRKLSGLTEMTQQVLPESIALVIDDYGLSQDESVALFNAANFTVILDDDLNDEPLHANLIVNPTPNASLPRYQARQTNARICLGPQYTFLRSEFAQIETTPINERKNILISLGGTDPNQLALIISRTVLQLNIDANIELLLGSLSHPQIQEIKQLAIDEPRFSFICSPPSVALVMARAGLAVSAAGSTLGELASLGVPAIILITSDNQILALTSALNNTWYQAIDIRSINQQSDEIKQKLLTKIKSKVDNIWHNKHLQLKMSRQAHQLIDTHGCIRVINELQLGLTKSRISHDCQ